MPSPAPARAPLSSITLDAATFVVIHQHNADIARQPASLTKLMTAYAAYECVEERGRSWGAEVTIAADDVHAVADDETRMGLVPGETVTLARLLEGLMIVSGNDAALAIARHLDGSQPAFLERMNRHARQLGLRSSWFASVSGITTPHHASSARDMAVLAACLLNDHPQILAITAQRAFVHGSFSRNNQNALLGDDGVDGLKTGYTQAAGFCLAATACRAVPGRDQPVRLITVVLGSESRDARDALVRDQLAAGFATLASTTAGA
ncbi:TPA: D-alanyl-D-alanine carboxypeptidase family protein [Stenotrophomonas maltophilia]|uniref:D-alanyl-D-alanine carboxypeptidase family protein n=1 Tax=Stenotrophomonas TaxID=40323 RepID=UPI0027E557C9|nr:D-alanyl-D-alanine carboxypeptidase family protein [Stenotrophomonas sp. Sm3119]EKT4069395.1 D-alanyl-D-alanine carboxypeptidase [Stenotrophomonas maltophilia]EKT4077625.1 D-alanyl-D-alanine carboxypeptidase [Stenotrophomonas maltophilia]MDQ7306770.1 D-alanyl-D-alanine carboxypeptidase [Stenotrophomonas sp. Sm3119]